MKKEKIQGKTLAEPAKKEGVAAVNRALQILGAFESSEDGLTLSMLAVETGLYESTILRLLDSVILAGLVTRLTDGRYVVGPRVLRLSALYRRSFKLAAYVLQIGRSSCRERVCQNGYITVVGVP